MILNRLIRPVVFFLLVVSVISCNKATNSNIVGQWDLTSRKINNQSTVLTGTFSLVFNADQTGNTTVNGSALNEFTWDLNTPDQIITVTFNVSGDTTGITVLTKNGDYLKTTFYDVQIGSTIEDEYQKQ